MDLPPGTRIDKYILGQQLGRGGFGAVYVAQDSELDRTVAIKLLLPEHTTSAQILQRFLQEARSAAKIGHPGIVTVHESGRVEGTGTPADGSAYIVMELLRGETLTARLARLHRLGPESAIDICWQVASALDAAHASGIIHRDLKPDNVFLMQDPAASGGERVKVLDFGIAKLADSTTTGGIHTHTLMVFGTPKYMSPEQCKSSARIDQRSDIYSLGCILFELVTGRAPFIGDPGELLALQQLATPPTVLSLAPDAPPGLAALTMRMLEKDPARRPASMVDVQQELRSPSTSARMTAQSISSGLAPTLPPDASGLAVPAHAQTPAPTAPRRRRTRLVAGIVTAVIAAGATVAIVVQRGHVADDTTPLTPEVGVAVLGVLTPAPKPPAPTGSGQAISEHADSKNVATALSVAGGSGRGPQIPDVAEGAGSNTVPVGRVSVNNKQAFDDSTLTADIVLSKIQSAYMAGLKRCYKDQLKQQPTARFALALNFTVNATGRAVNATARTTPSAAALDDCVKALISTWRFPVPKDKDGEPTEAAFTIKLTLIPD